jgi:hypothetical protein
MGNVMTSEKITFKPALSFKSHTITTLHDQIARQKQVLRAVQAVLPYHLATELKHCLVKDNKLLIYTDSSVWASQLRFYQGAILATTSPLIEGVTSVQIRMITQQVGLVTRSEHKAKLPSAEKIVQMHRDSLNIADEQLRLSLLSLSATLTRLTKNSTE